MITATHIHTHDNVGRQGRAGRQKGCTNFPTPDVPLKGLMDWPTL